MNPKYLWLTETMELLTFFVIGPALGIVVAYAAWRGKPRSFNRETYGVLCIGSGVACLLLVWIAKWIDADVRNPQYFVQLASVLLSFLLLGVSMGCGFALLLRYWHWHKSTRLR